MTAAATVTPHVSVDKTGSETAARRCIQSIIITSVDRQRRKKKEERKRKTSCESMLT